MDNPITAKEDTRRRSCCFSLKTWAQRELQSRQNKRRLRRGRRTSCLQGCPLLSNAPKPCWVGAELKQLLHL